jgi:hypothetical protein
MPYEWEEWALRALSGIEPSEVGQVLAGKQRWPRPATAASGVRVLTVWGRTGSGRTLVVALHPLDGQSWTIIGARDLTTAEYAEFTRWEETR